MINRRPVSTLVAQIRHNAHVMPLLEEVIDVKMGNTYYRARDICDGFVRSCHKIDKWYRDVSPPYFSFERFF